MLPCSCRSPNARTANHRLRSAITVVRSLDRTGRFVEVRREHGTKHWQGAPGETYYATTGEFGGLWRFRGRAPQRLVGVGFTAQGFDRNSPFRRMPGSFDPRATFIFVNEHRE